MKPRGLTYFVALIVALLCAFADLRASAEEEPAASAGMTILGQCDGAKVYVDGNYVAMLPQASPISLAPGLRKLRLVKLGFTPFEQDVRAIPGRVLSLEVELVPFAGVLRITSEPSGAAIYLDDQNAGQTPAELEIRTGPHTVSTRLEGYYPETFSLPISPGDVVVRTVHLNPLPAAKNPNRPVKIQVRPWYTRWWVWPLIIGGTAALTVAIAVPAVIATRSTCDKLGAEVCFPISLMPNALETRTSGLQLGVRF